MNQLLIERIIWISVALLGYGGFLSLLLHNRRLNKVLTIDPLTGAKNRRGFMEALKQIIDHYRPKQTPPPHLCLANAGSR